jgi:hypothetical protein
MNVFVLILSSARFISQQLMLLEIYGKLEAIQRLHYLLLQMTKWRLLWCRRRPEMKLISSRRRTFSIDPGVLDKVKFQSNLALCFGCHACGVYWQILRFRYSIVVSLILFFTYTTKKNIFHLQQTTQKLNISHSLSCKP